MTTSFIDTNSIQPEIIELIKRAERWHIFIRDNSTTDILFQLQNNLESKDEQSKDEKNEEAYYKAEELLTLFFRDVWARRDF